jgi:hypothetical protein
MYGPPPDPRQQLAPTSFAEAWPAWVACVVVGVAIAWMSGTRRPLGFIVGTIVALTTPFAWFLPTYVYGAFPTIDKAGSLLFYLDGVQWRFWDASDPAVRLIGVHVGHLWVVALFDLVLQSFAAFNAEAGLHLVLGWYCAYLLLDELTGDREVSLLLGAPFGLGLHLFRDINWYTVEKTSVFWLPLYAWALVRAHRRGGRWIALSALIFVGTCLDNLYFGILAAGMGAVALLSGSRRVALAVVASAVASLPIFGMQMRLLHGDAALGDPQLFLTQRAALDTFDLWPPKWNRLEALRALNVVAIGLALRGARRDWRLAAVAAVFFVLALGPTHNPVYMLLFEVVPGFWRIAKPETFFEVTWLATLCIAARELARLKPARAMLGLLGAVFVVGWVLSVRTHPVFPVFTRYVPMELSGQWERALPKHR